MCDGHNRVISGPGSTSADIWVWLLSGMIMLQFLCSLMSKQQIAAGDESMNQQRALILTHLILPRLKPNRKAWVFRGPQCRHSSCCSPMPGTLRGCKRQRTPSSSSMPRPFPQRVPAPPAARSGTVRKKHMGREEMCRTFVTLHATKFGFSVNFRASCTKHPLFPQAASLCRRVVRFAWSAC